MRKIIVILGPTASGKSDLSVRLAKKFNGEIISADSRQVYKGMDIGTGKVPISYGPPVPILSKSLILFEIEDPRFCIQIENLDKIGTGGESTKSSIPAQAGIQMFYKGIRHHLLDVASPKTKFDVVKYKKLADKAIEDILKRGKLPIVCGGTGFYIQAIVDNVIFPEVASNPELRKKLGKQPIKKLLQILKKLDSARFKTVDQKNKRRVIRAIEISKALGKVPKLKSNPKYDALQIGIDIDKETLKENIKKRLEKRLKQGMTAEVKKLHQQGLPAGRHGVSWKKLIEFGLEYKFTALYLQNKITKQEMTDQLKSASWQYAKRQMTWFKRDKRIVWVDNKIKAGKLIKKFAKIKTSA